MGVIINQQVQIKPNRFTKYYQEKGYLTYGPNTLITINLCDLLPASAIRIQVQCDYCNTFFLKQRNTIKNLNDTIACAHCSVYKGRQTNLQKYGVEYTTQSENMKEKSKQTFLQNFGVDNPNKAPCIKQKKAKTNLERYGNECSMNGITKEKIKQNNLQIYGVEHYSQTDEFKNKFKETSLERYGTENPMQNDTIKEKSMKNKKNKNRTYSKQQKYLNNLLNGEINKYLCGYYADIYLQQYNIIIEYDGSGHWYGVKHYQITLEEFTKLEQQREDKIIENGYKIIRFISKKDKLPNDNIIANLIGYCINLILDISNKIKIIKINIDEEKIYFCNQFIDINIGQTKKL